MIWPGQGFFYWYKELLGCVSELEYLPLEALKELGLCLRLMLEPTLRKHDDPERGKVANDLHYILTVGG